MQEMTLSESEPDREVGFDDEGNVENRIPRWPDRVERSWGQDVKDSDLYFGRDYTVDQEEGLGESLASILQEEVPDDIRHIEGALPASSEVPLYATRRENGLNRARSYWAARGMDEVEVSLGEVIKPEDELGTGIFDEIYRVTFENRRIPTDDYVQIGKVEVGFTPRQVAYGEAERIKGILEKRIDDAE